MPKLEYTPIEEIPKVRSYSVAIQTRDGVGLTLSDRFMPV